MGYGGWLRGSSLTTTAKAKLELKPLEFVQEAVVLRILADCFGLEAVWLQSKVVNTGARIIRIGFWGQYTVIMIRSPKIA